MKQNAEREGITESSRNSLWKNKEAQERLDVLHEELVENQSGGTSLIKEEVTKKILPGSSKWTGIPVMKMLQGERENYYISSKNFTIVS
jgi:ATP-dependent Clp protease ATP-binding subunit ClpB